MSDHSAPSFSLTKDELVRLTAAVVWELREALKHPHSRSEKPRAILRRLQRAVDLTDAADAEDRCVEGGAIEAVNERLQATEASLSSITEAR